MFENPRIETARSWLTSSALALGLVLTPGCAFGSALLTRAGAAPREAGEPQPREAPQSELIRRLTPLESGPGVLVCEPAGAVENATLHFGAGCGRWLHLMVGGHGEFGKTPLWSSVDRVRRELGRDNLRLAPGEAKCAARKLGVTHVALGRLEKADGKLTLSYQLHRAPDGQPVGEPVCASGSEAEIVHGLPQIARRLVRELGVAEPRVPEAAGETVEGLREIGSHPWVPEEPLADVERSRLEKLADGMNAGPPAGKDWKGSRLASITMLAFHGRDPEAGLLSSHARRLPEALPENALAYGEIGMAAMASAAGLMPELHQEQRQALLQRFPHNSLFRLMEAGFHVLSGKTDEARKSAELHVRCSASDSASWGVLEEAIHGQADAVRHGRFLNELAFSEQETVTALYEEALPVAIWAVRLDPEAPELWVEVSQNAAFLGVEELADRALEKALELDPKNRRALRWGVQLYQPRWLDRPDTLLHVAKLAVAAADRWCWSRRVELALDLHHAALKEQAQAMLRSEVEKHSFREHLALHSQAAK